ncbi:OstA-like protein [Paludibacter sp. 221]|uniref:OstA-like protein n=1 Tax=Paludibacter sp. 221 TaxID=2302939 RepID=UPI0013D7BF30|nr:OstA-like protein [Paludibacter sp. 221]
MEKSDSVNYDESRLPGAQIIFGSPVRFRHDNAVMYCDSAHLYNKDNSFHAFGNVRIVEGDSIFIYGDILRYNGNTKMARLRRNVRMENSTAVLTTDSLNYDRAADLAYYYTGGKLQDDQNTLTSVWGQYSPDTKQALFKNKVHLVNESFTMDADTLKYNTDTHVADIVGDTHIIYDDETNIYSTNGWYNTDTEQSMLMDRSLIVHADGKTVVGDTLFYDKQKQFVKGYNLVEMSDSIQKITLCGNYVFYDEANEYGLATDSAYLIDWSSADSLYLHADAFHLLKDSTYDVAQAFHNVRFYRSDLQGACDSLVYMGRDSVATMYGEPVIWSGLNQISGENIQAFIKDETIDHIFIPHSAMAIQKVQSLDSAMCYNQLAGKELTAFMLDGELVKVEVSGNAETIYCPVDEADNTVVVVNKTQSSYVTMHFKEQKIDRVVLTTVSSGTGYPLGDLSGDELYLNNFFWIEEQRPQKKEDIFLTYPGGRHKSNVTHTRSAASSTEPVSAASSSPDNENGTQQRRTTRDPNQRR